MATIGADGGYTGVIITFSPRLTAGNNSVALIQNIIVLLKDSSDFLFAATRNHTFLKEVTIVVPSSWLNVLLRQTDVQYERSGFRYEMQNADVRVDVPNPLHGNRPHTHQPMTCGKNARFIHYTPDYLERFSDGRKYGDHRKVFVHNWSRLRYGVFEEFGYHGDDIYNEFFHDDDGSIKPASCSDVPVEGAFRKFQDNSTCSSNLLKNLTDENCRFVRLNSNMTSSLMYLMEPSDVKTFCDSGRHPHGIMAPTKQNFLCDYRNTWDIISTSPDFSRIVQPSKKSTTIKVKLNKGANDLSYAFVFDYSKKILKNRKNEILFVSLNNFNNVTVNNEASIKYVGCSEDGAEEQPLRKLFETPESKTPCVSCGIHKSINLKSDVVILITDGIVNSTERSKIQSLVTQRPSLRLYVILYPMTTGSDARWWTDLADGGSVFAVETEAGPVENIKSLHKLYIDIFRQRGPQNVFLEFPPAGAAYNGVFTSQNVSDVILTCVGSSKPYFELNCSDIQLHYKSTGPSPRMYFNELFKVMKLDRLHGNWSYLMNVLNDTCLLYIRRLKNRQVMIGSWVGSNSDGQVELVNGGLAIYAEVFVDEYQPVVNARVTATVVFRPENGMASSEVNVSLIDNGSGDPDLTLNDGVYSGYLTFPVDKGTYQVITTIQATDDTVVNSFRLQNDSVDACCGSFVPLLDIQSVEPFNQTITLKMFNLDVDKHKTSTFPSRIGDLKCVYDSYENNKTSGLRYKVNLTWTAPGAFLTTGRASSYEIRTSNSRKNLTTDFDSATEVFDQNASPLEPYERELITISLQSPGLNFFAIRAVDKHDNVGKLSNIAEANIVEVKIPTTTIADSPEKKWTSGFILVIVGVCLLLFLSCTLITYFVMRRVIAKKRKKVKKLEDLKNSKRMSAEQVSEIYSIADTLKTFDVGNQSSHPHNVYDNPALDSSNLDDVSMTPSPRKSFRRITLV